MIYMTTLISLILLNYQIKIYDLKGIRQKIPVERGMYIIKVGKIETLIFLE